MGAKQSVFDEDVLENYQRLTYLTRKEILRLYKKFCALAPDQLNPKEYGGDVIIGKEKVLQLEELQVNPFRNRICEVFSSSPDGDGSFTFEDFLDMASVFGEEAPNQVKMEQAFKIYDMDGDGTISRKDLRKVILCMAPDLRLGDEELTSQRISVIAHDSVTSPDKPLKDQILDNLVDQIFQEADVDEEDTSTDMPGLSYPRFQIVISKSPDFANLFHIRL